MKARDRYRSSRRVKTPVMHASRKAERRNRYHSRQRKRKFLMFCFINGAVIATIALAIYLYLNATEKYLPSPTNSKTDISYSVFHPN